jgi:hypothetical protein
MAIFLAHAGRALNKIRQSLEYGQPGSQLGQPVCLFECLFDAFGFHGNLVLKRPD